MKNDEDSLKIDELYRLSPLHSLAARAPRLPFFSTDPLGHVNITQLASGKVLVLVVLVVKLLASSALYCATATASWPSWKLCSASAGPSFTPIKA